MSETTGTALVIGTGLIGGSIGLALREAGWLVLGADRDAEHLAKALEVGAIDASVELNDELPPVDVAFVATTVGAIPAAVDSALRHTSGVVTDVGSVKKAVVASTDNPRFVGGHPMAGSEQDGVTGARADLFRHAVWVLTPDDDTPDDTFALLHSVIAGTLGAEVVTLAPDAHDRLVAMVSHVPHLTAATLMRLATARSDEHRALLRLAAGGFRDMTRIAAGHPDIWLDICRENQAAITEVLDGLIDALQDMRGIIANDDSDRLLQTLADARAARVSLPSGVPDDIQLGELRVPILDRPGGVASITGLASEIGVNIYDLEIAHSSEGQQGVLILVVDHHLGERLVGALMAKDWRPSLRPLS